MDLQNLTRIAKSNVPVNSDTSLLAKTRRAYFETFIQSMPPEGEEQKSNDASGKTELANERVPIKPKYKYARQYFITINLSPNSKMHAKHDGKYGIYFWWNLTQSEQVKFLEYVLNKFHQKYNDTRLIGCYESCESGHIHIHFLLDTNIKHNKHVKIRLFDIIYNGVQRQKDIRNIMKHFCYIELFDFLKWNDYFNKKVKTYQTTQFDLIIIDKK